MEKVKTYLQKFNSCQRGNVATRIAGALLMGLMTLMLMINIIPEIEALVIPVTITNTFVTSMLELAIWVLPVAGVLGLFYWIFKVIKG